MATQTYTVIADAVNVRNLPATNGTVVRVLFQGQQILIDSDVQQTTADGWLWRRIAGASDQWVAEVNQTTNFRLIELVDDTVNPPDTSAEQFRVTADALNIRSAPSVSGSILGMLRQGEVVELIVDNQQTTHPWVWRRLAGSQERWIAEKNLDTSERFLEKIETTVEPPENGNGNGNGSGEGNGGGDGGGSVVDPEPEDTETYIARTILNVRSQPTIANNVIGQISQGQQVKLIADVQQIDGRGFVWRRIENDAEQWVAEGNRNNQAIFLQRIDDGGEGGGVIGRVQTSGTGFLLDGKAFRFVGGNLREFPFYTTHAMEHANANHQRLQLEGIRNMGMRVVRMHVCHREIDINQTKVLVRDALDQIHRHNLLAIMVLNDALFSNFYIPDDQPFHTETMGHLHKRYFLQRGYEQNYLPFVKLLVADLKDHPAIFAWELGNEYAIHPQPASAQDGNAFLNFASHVSDTIRGIDPNHLITTGLINVNQVKPSTEDHRAYAKRLYSLPNLDFGTVHFYQSHPGHTNSEEDRCRPDLEVLKSLNKPTIVEEFGATAGNNNRFEYTRDNLQEWFDLGAVGFMQWGLSITNSDINAGDNLHGLDNFSPNNRDLFQPLFNLYKSWADRLSNG